MRVSAHAEVIVPPGGGHGQDAHCVVPRDGLLAVADGVGGVGRHGGVASRAAIDELCAAVAEARGDGALPMGREAMFGALARCEAAIAEAVARTPDCGRANTTLTACVVSEATGAASFLHVGDSRAYLVRGDTVRQLTRDHTTAGLFEEPDAAPAEGVPKGALVAYLGGSGPSPADFFVHELRAGDRLVLCTDGLVPCVSLAEIVDAAGSAGPEESCKALIRLAGEREPEDDVTLVIAMIDDASS
jgi:PPM family protein phosphatase